METIPAGIIGRYYESGIYFTGGIHIDSGA